MDIYAVFRFLDVRIYGPSFSAFRQKYAVMGGYQRKQITGFQRLDELEQLMSRITFRVGKEVLDLPPETHVTYYCDLAGEALRIYRDLEQDFVARVLDGTVTAANAMVKLLRLQQVTGGVVPTDDGIARRVDNSKQKLLADTLEDIGKDEPVVVFCRFHADLDAVHEACEQNEFASLELSGRRDELKRWQDGEAQVLAVQISAGGVGVDLTRARYSMYYSLSFSLGEYDQALSRVHRPGQTRPVEHIHLVARNTVDVKIMRALEKRAEIVQAILAEIKS
jgi:SNF2 family DNA or RNA helicase